MIRISWIPVFADVVAPVGLRLLPVALTVAVLLLAAGLLAHFIGKSRRDRKNRDEKGERK